MPHLPTSTRSRLNLAVRHALFAGLLAGGPLLLAMPVSPAVASEQTRSYAIPAGNLDQALNRFASEAGILLSADGQLTAGKRSPGLNGSYSVDEGLARLLAGTGLRALNTGGNYALEVAVNSGDALELGATTIASDKIAAGVFDIPGGLQARGANAGFLGDKDTMELPFSVSSYTSAFIRNQRAVTVADALAYDPAVSLSQTGGMVDSYSIRGFPYGEGNVGEVALDGVYGVAPNYRLFSHYVERIEVIKGPAGLLYGMSPDSAVGGVINVVPKRAEDGGLTRLTTNLASQSAAGGHLDIGERFGDDGQFGIRMNVAHESGDTAVDHQRREVSVGSLALDYRGERLKLALDAIVQNEQWDAPSRVFALASGVDVPSAPDGSTNPTQQWGWSELDDRSLLLSGEYELSEGLSLFANAGRGFSQVERSYDQLLTFTDDRGSLRSTQRYARFEVERETASAGFRSRFATGPVEHELSLQANALQVTNYLGLNDGVTLVSNVYDPIYYPKQPPSTHAHAPRVSESDLSGLALADTLSFFDERLQLLIGLRHQRIESNNWDRLSRARTSSYRDEALSPSAGIILRPWQDLMLYASYIEGLSKGDVAPSTASNAGEAFAPYTTKQYEIGAKLDHGDLHATLALFQITKPSGQLQNNVYEIGAEQRNRGIEIALQGQTSERLRLYSGLTLTDAELTRTNNQATRGNQAIGAPRLQAKMGMEWDTPWLDGLTTTAGVIHVGKQYVDTLNSARLPSWTRVDLGARYALEVDGRPVTLALNLQNAFNRQYWSGVSQWSAFSLGSPRTLALSAAVDF